ncbi:MAG: hypothetical protein LQ337_007484 [Flavoplaca oasis]|nr:MAG: hypothetical protein LQ337_007484 [Flavoplaca oasis]
MSYLRNFKNALRSRKKRIEAVKSRFGATGESLGNRAEESALETQVEQPQTIALPSKSNLTSTKTPLDRLLNLSSEGTIGVVGGNCDRTKSPLLQRLPLEIRLQIWREVLGGNLFHMGIDIGGDGWRRQTQYLGRYLCRDFSTDMASASCPRCQGSQAEPCFFVGPEIAPFRFKPLSLLLTCKQVHDEAVGFLYSANTFNFDYEGVLFQFLALDAKRHIHHIRTVHVNAAMWRIVTPEMDPDYNVAHPALGRGERWTEFWPLLLKFEGLQHVRLDIYGTAKDGLRMEHLEPILQLRGLKTFDLAIWRVVCRPDGPKQDLALSLPLQESIRRSVYR